jgi:hypothetical protein
MKNVSTTILFGIGLILGLVACQDRYIHTRTIYDSPMQFVRLEVDHTVGGDHSHPADVTTAEMTAVLSGIIINEPPRLMPSWPFFSKDEEPPRHPAFNATEIRFLAPLLAKGLGMAAPEEVVTFYLATRWTAIIRKVTSGGIFVDDDELHIVVSNYRSPTHYAPDPWTSETYDRLTPLRSIAPQQTTLDFEPATAIAQPRKGFLSGLFRPDRQEIIVLFKKLRPGTADIDRASH